MSAGTDVFGDIANLATALGVLDNGQISTDFFVDPAAAIGGTLRDATRRAALLQFLDDILGDSAPQVQESGATWTPVFQLSDNVHLYLVTAQVAAGVTVGFGVRGATSGTPGAEGRLSVPLALIPPSGTRGVPARIRFSGRGGEYLRRRLMSARPACSRSR